MAKRLTIIFLVIILISALLYGCSLISNDKRETGQDAALDVSDGSGEGGTLPSAGNTEGTVDGTSDNASSGEGSDTASEEGDDASSGKVSGPASEANDEATEDRDDTASEKGSDPTLGANGEGLGLDDFIAAGPDIAPDVAEGIIKEIADKVIHAIADKDFDTVSGFAHPEFGIRFTPYTCPSPERDLVFDSEGIKNFFTDDNTYMWGYYDGSGFDIELTPGDYYKEFIYPVDFANVTNIGYNTVLSNTIMYENQFEVYRNSIIVEYYYPGTPENTGLDWKSLRLVFQQYEDSWMLTGIISNQWTI